MSHEAFLHLAQETYLGLIACIESVDLQATVLLELASQSREEERSRKARRRTNGIDPKTTMTNSSSLVVPGSVDSPIPTIVTPTSPSLNDSSLSSSDDSSTLSTEIMDVLTAVTELSNVRFSKVIGVRSEVHSQLPLSEFLEIFDSTWSFVLQCEVIVKRMIVGLRGAMVSQSKGWLMSFHQKRITDNAKLVEEEQWSASEVPGRIQRQVELIVKGAMVDPEELLLGQRRVKVKEVENGDKKDEGEETAKQVDIEGRQFFAVSAGLATIDTLVEYLQVVLNCPMLTTDAMSKVIEFMKVRLSIRTQFCSICGRLTPIRGLTGLQLSIMSSRPRSGSYAISWAQEHHSEESRFVPSSPCDSLSGSRSLCPLYSSCFSSAIDHGLAYPLHPRTHSKTPQSETSSDVDRIRQAQARLPGASERDSFKVGRNHE